MNRKRFRPEPTITKAAHDHRGRPNEENYPRRSDWHEALAREQERETVSCRPNPARPGEKEIFVRLEDIVPDYAWNARSPANVVGDSDSDSGGGLRELAGSMALKGQDVALVVRPNVQKKDRS